MNKNILILAGLFILTGCSTMEVAQTIGKYNLNRDTRTSKEQTQNNYIAKKGEEFDCLVVDGSYDAQAHCKNSNNTIRFYTTYREISKKYKILHKTEISTNHTNTYALPNYKIAHFEIWITKK